MNSVDIMARVAPLIQLIQDVAEPCAYGMTLFGFIKIALSDSVNWKKIIKQAIYGYVGVQITPWIFEVIESVL